MRTSIKINDQYIQKILLGSTPVQRIYQSGSIVYEAGGSTPCFEVVDTISEASGDYVNVYALDIEKWYKRNNLSQYEEYGIMPTVDSLTGVTTYTGKLVILSTDSHEYKWNGSQWVDLGECDYTIIHSPEYISRTSSYTGYVPLGDKFQENTVIEIDFQMTNDRGYAVIGDYWGNDNDDWRFFVNYGDGGYNGVNYDFDTARIQTTVSNTKARFHLEIGNYYAKYYGSSSNLITGTRKTNFNRPNQMYLFHMDGPISQVNEDYGNVYMLKITQDGVLSKDFIPWTDMNGNYGFYDLVSNTVYPSTGNMTGSNNVTDIQIGEPIEDYPTKVAPANNVHYDTLEELELMECPWIGMQATIGSNYIPYLYTATGWLKQYTPCFEVVNTISQSSGEYVDVYALNNKKWYKKNNLNQYEEYGVMPFVDELSNATYYTGKLVILSTDGHEYKWTGSQWNDLGYAGIGYNVIWLDPASNNSSYQIGYYWGPGYKMVCNVYLSGSYGGDTAGFLNNQNKSPLEFNFYNNGFYLDMHDPQSTSNNSCYSGDYSQRLMQIGVLVGYQSEQVINFTVTYGTVKAELEEGGTLIGKWGTERTGKSWYNGLYNPSLGIGSNKPYHLSRIQVYDNNNNLVNDLKFVENKGETGSQKLSMYDSVLDVKYDNTNSNTPTYHIIQKGDINPPEEYQTKVAPANNVHYNTLEELELMECPWIGMTATVGDNNIPYKYTEDGWVAEYSKSYLTIESLVDNNTIRFLQTSMYADISVKYSTNDGNTWSTIHAGLGEGATICTLNKGKKVIFKGNIISTLGKSCKFSGSGNFKIYGNILSLIYEYDFVNKTSIGSDRTFIGLFTNTNVVDAENLVLPVASLPKECYAYMFQSCTKLVKGPSLESVSSIGEDACYGMFDGCKSLATPINITVDTLSKQCMGYMFQNCTSLKSAIVNIGNITVNQSCLQQMFSGCTSLEDVEINYNGSLPTAGSSDTDTILYRCFYNCTSLKRIKAMFTSLGTNGSRVQTMEWVSGVPATGTFIKNVNATWDKTGVSGVPTGWTVETANP